MVEHLTLYDRNKVERDILKQQVRDQVAFMSNSRLEVAEFDREEKVRSYIEEGERIDLALMEIACASDIDLTRELRSRKQQAEMMLVAEDSVSPMEYMTPDIRACALLLKPFTTEDVRRVTRNFVSAYFRDSSKSSDDGTIVVENRQGKASIAFEKVYYIEVRGKKLHIRLQEREYSKYDTLEHIREILPDYFVQCHRSYIFNTRYMERVKLSENTIYLENGIMVPLARSFKPQIKEIISGQQ